MSTSLRLLAAGALFAAAAAFAAAPQISYAATPSTAGATTKAPAKTRTPQQQRMADCSHQAKVDGKKGAERRGFMSTCLKGPHTAAADTSSLHKAKVKAQPNAGAKG
ncbi:MAG TPA: PsiF family protein [Rhodanobacter sp.]|jgi:psiF repeat.